MTKKKFKQGGTTRSKGNEETCTFKLIAFHPPSRVFQQYPELKTLVYGHYSIWRETYYNLNELIMNFFYSTFIQTFAYTYL